MSYYRVDVDGARYLVGNIFPAGQLLNDEVAIQRGNSSTAEQAAGSFRRAAARIQTVIDDAHETTRRMSAFTGESVAGVQSVLEAFLLSDQEMAQATARSMNHRVAPDAGAPFDSARFSSTHGMR